MDVKEREPKKALKRPKEDPRVKALKERRSRIGQELARKRMERGIELSEVRKKTGLNGPQLEGIEHGWHSYTIDSLIKYCDAIGCKVVGIGG